MSEVISYQSEVEKQRIDRAISAHFTKYSRSRVQHWLKNDRITVNGQVVKANYQVQIGDHIQIDIPEPTPLEAIPEKIPLDIIFEDQDVMVVNKPQGMVVHPSPGHPDHTLVNALLYHTHFKGINDKLRPGIVHRIDKDTSGLLMIAKNEMAVQSLTAQLKAKTNERAYLAIVHGIIQEPAGTINAPIGRDPKDRKRQAIVRDGRPAVTHFTILERFPKSQYTLIKCVLETGRTHQIRVHLKYIGHPLAGDPVYGPKKTLPGNGQFLHAETLGFKHPRTNEELQFSIEPPKIFQQTLKKLRTIG
ncbi:RluA family pseudouridine synthase [Agrilactobacillus fermenti]|uniref:RluA family pseudouridine synthase n=1 Tax=Agrilactobacillus fermenti TaxID=2586909 RepID=UPI001E435F8A|nr:RluA family pseudouridine synthase [Agrilactobacillus fermenti]MCD2256589.1 RluA family pseudouridine synthase [Agrilactobacillus fermenti]